MSRVALAMTKLYKRVKWQVTAYCECEWEWIGDGSQWWSIACEKGEAKTNGLGGVCHMWEHTVTSLEGLLNRTCLEKTNTQRLSTPYSNVKVLNHQLQVNCLVTIDPRQRIPLVTMTVVSVKLSWYLLFLKSILTLCKLYHFLPADVLKTLVVHTSFHLFPFVLL